MNKENTKRTTKIQQFERLEELKRKYESVKDKNWPLEQRYIGEIAKATNALRTSGCFSANSERMRWRCFIADNLSDAQRYVDGKNFYFRVALKEAGVPIRPSVVRGLISLIKITKGKEGSAKTPCRTKPTRKCSSKKSATSDHFIEIDEVLSALVDGKAVLADDDDLNEIVAIKEACDKAASERVS